MVQFDYGRMGEEARMALKSAAGSPRKLIMLHSGVTLGLGLILSVVGYLLNMGIAQTGGLGGIGMRSALETVQSVLEVVNMVLLPFWSVGYIRAALKWKDREAVDGRTLLFGFHNWGPVLRSLLLQGIVYTALMILGTQLASVVYLMTPAAQSMYALVEKMGTLDAVDVTAWMQSEEYQAIFQGMIPYALAGMALFAVPVAWRLRFTDYALMEAPEQGALRAMLRSLRMTRKRFWPLLKLDLRFWWFYLAQGLILVLGYGDLLLEMAGVELGIHTDAAMFVFYIAALICEFGLYVWKKNEVFVTYALAYAQLAEPRQMPPKPQPKNEPWNY